MNPVPLGRPDNLPLEGCDPPGEKLDLTDHVPQERPFSHRDAQVSAGVVVFLRHRRLMHHTPVGSPTLMLDRRGCCQMDSVRIGGPHLAEATRQMSVWSEMAQTHVREAALTVNENLPDATIECARLSDRRDPRASSSSSRRVAAVKTFLTN